MRGIVCAARSSWYIAYVLESRGLFKAMVPSIN